MPLTAQQMRVRAALADGLSVANGASGVAGVMLLLMWRDPRALLAACACVFVAWGFDSVDGLAARGVVRSPSEGAILDSLCDTNSFGALPAALLAAYGARRFAADPALAAVCAAAGIAYFSCAVLRLRRYTVGAVSHDAEERTSFKGVPSPVAAMSVSAALLAALTSSPLLTWLPVVFALAAAPLMLSRVPYTDTPHLAKWMWRVKWPLPLLAAFAYVVGNPAVALAVFFAAYFASGAIGRRSQPSTNARLGAS